VREKYCWLVADKPSEQGVLVIDWKVHFQFPKIPNLTEVIDMSLNFPK
jgi:hypothetical protein